MKKFVFIILVIGLAVYLTGCGKKQQALEEMQEPLSMEALSSINASTTTPGQPVPPTEIQGAQSAVPMAGEKLEPLPPVERYKPTSEEIQTALKNAGYYTGPVDGKIGPLSKKAIEDFQKANSLQADGKVGPKTWAVLGGYLNPTPAPAPQSKKR